MPAEDTMKNYEERGFSHVRDVGGAGNSGPTIKSVAADVDELKKRLAVLEAKAEGKK